MQFVLSESKGRCIYMKFSISANATSYINEKGGKIVIYLGKRSLGGCTGASIPTPLMKLGNPDHSLEKYQIINQAGITIYVSNELQDYNGTAQIKLDKIMFLKSLSFDYQRDK